MSVNTLLSPASGGRVTAIALVTLLVLTRLGHFGELSRLPDASWAVFFVGGLLLRDARVFGAFFGLAWSVDLGAMALGTPVDCFSVAYLFLIPAYGALWWAGRALAAVLAVGHRASGVAGALLAVGLTALALCGAVAVAFVLSNLGFWAFGEGFAPLSAADYAARVAQYFPGILLVTFVYAFTALGAQVVAARLAGEARLGA